MTAPHQSPSRFRPGTAAGLACALALVAACPGDDGGNPDRLYLALLNSETSVQLVDHEPEPF
jgi:hypothetical protein